jgi:2-oxoglutarate dehydrogenase E2 component (dihydrolipoamide succinyltransferase)
MLIDVKTPELSDSITEGTLLEWHKQPGDTVARDETLIDLETDKVILEISAPASGVLVETLRENGAVVHAGEVIARIDDGTAEVAVAPAAKPVAAPPVARTVQAVVPVPVAVTPQPDTVLRLVAPPAVDLRQGRSERRIPMTRLRARIAERLVAAQHTAAILTTFNE